jgi:probable rRNA maturation factor
MSVEVTIQIARAGVTKRDVRRAVEHALAAESEDLSLSVVLVDDATIHDINRRFLAHDYPTDVIAFDLRGGGGPDGEIFVSVTTAKREAEKRGVDVASEILLYCVHGTLHLLGYDDHEPRDRRRMQTRQRSLLAALGRQLGP